MKRVSPACKGRFDAWSCFQSGRACSKTSAMDFLGTPDVGPLLFVGLSAASFVTAFIGVFTGSGGRRDPARDHGHGDAAGRGDSGPHRGDARHRHIAHRDHVALRPARHAAALRRGRGDRRRGGRQGFRRAADIVAAGHSRRLHPAGDLDAAPRTHRRRARTLRGARLRHRLPRRVRERDRLAARALRRQRHRRTGTTSPPPWAR